MKTTRIIFISIALGIVVATVFHMRSNRMVSGVPSTSAMSATTSARVMSDGSEAAALANLTDDQWKGRLTPNQYAVLRKGGTEVPFTSPLLEEKRAGTYVTADCGEPVFRSEQKFETGTGWPSFYAPIRASAVIERADDTMGASRTEVVSAICKSHLGHVFKDAPQTPTGLRYCMNGLALVFIPDTVQ